MSAVQQSKYMYIVRYNIAGKIKEIFFAKNLHVSNLGKKNNGSY
jgi:hypothetical protein